MNFHKILIALFISLLFCIHTTSVRADTVSQLDITGGSISLNLGPIGSVTGDFNQNGTLVMGQFQPPPNIFPPITIDGHTFSIFTDSSNGLFTPPSAQVSGTTITADLSSLFAGITGPNINGMLNIGGLATGTYDPNTGQFTLSWKHVYVDLSSFDMNLQGTTELAPVPLPATLGLFVTGLFALAAFLVLGGRERLLMSYPYRY
jgi:hypothetical protein